MQRIFLKFLFLIASAKYPRIRRDYRYFIRDNYFSRLYQLKYLFRDFVSKKRYKIIEFGGEFQQELTFILPFAYWHHLNGTLEKTVSCKNTRLLYFFSEKHEERFESRDWNANSRSFEVPNMNHSITFSFNKWARVPLKDQYKNDLFIYDNPTLIIANKYNIEWDGAPLNFFDIKTLDRIINHCKGKYQIIYNRPLANQIVSDNSEILDLNEHDWLRQEHPEVLLMNDLYEQFSTSVENFNHLQLMVYANCSRFISVHGGTAAFASYFGGVNIILSKRGIEHELNEFNTIFPALSGATVLHAKEESDIFRYLPKYY